MKLLKIVLIILCFAFALMGIVFTFLLTFGYRPIIIENTIPDWNAINTIAACISALATIAIPVVIFVLDKRMKQRADETQTVLLKELSDFKNEYEEKLKTLSTLVTENGDIVIDSGEIDVKNDHAKFG